MLQSFMFFRVTFQKCSTLFNIHFNCTPSSSLVYLLEIMCYYSVCTCLKHVNVANVWVKDLLIDLSHVHICVLSLKFLTLCSSSPQFLFHLFGTPVTFAVLQFCQVLHAVIVQKTTVIILQYVITWQRHNIKYGIFFTFLRYIHEKRTKTKMLMVSLPFISLAILF